MLRMQETTRHLQTPQFSKLFKEVSLFIKEFGVKHLLEYLLIINHTSKDTLESDSDFVNVSTLITDSINKYGVEFIYLVLKTNQTKSGIFGFSKNKNINDKVFEIVCCVFRTTPQIILDKYERDGVRVYASGTLYKLFFDVLGYSVDEVIEITKKDRTAISRHKNAIKNLDPKHPSDRKVLIKYIDSKKQLIKYILNEYQEK